ncbi:hypothetical protein M407DRAFT_245285 [Tulasnella calospora MUT 4182]|uniref:Uncharacterized protein n=1 Tax=Tulasnella calospora MUT 4182 TaxID=1051891 RepID=A0A0C3QAT8_9AGAM|nr:hypothetical protein M407DRAFT_245285 [Tulasnella calospora MUT 4182]
MSLPTNQQPISALQLPSLRFSNGRMITGTQPGRSPNMSMTMPSPAQEEQGRWQALRLRGGCCTQDCDCCGGCLDCGCSCCDGHKEGCWCRCC